MAFRFGVAAAKDRRRAQGDAAYPLSA